MNLEGKKVLITGGGSGIGFQLAKKLSSAGCAITICGRDKAKLERAQQMLTALRIYQCDISSWEQQDRLVEDLRHNSDLPDILVNNAGVIWEADFANGDASWEHISMEIEINLLAPIRLVHRLLPRLKEQPESAIVNVTTGLVYAPSVKHPVYCASKAGLHSFSISLRHQLKDTSVEVFEVIPPPVDTELNTSSDPKIPPEEVATAVVKAIKAGRHEINVGRAKALSIIARITPRGALKMVNG